MLPLGITAEELWEHRNSLLHMTNLDARKVVAGRVRRLVFYVGNLPSGSPKEDTEAKWYSFQDLIQAIVKGCGCFLERLSASPELMNAFIQRYDLVVSDTRYPRLALKFD